MKIRTSPVASAFRIGICIAGVIYLCPETTVRNMLPGELERLAEARITTTYVLGERSWASFTLPPGKRLLKIATNAVVGTPASRQDEPGEADEQYSLRYQVTDSSGRVLMDRVYWQKARPRDFIDPATGDTIASRFFVGEAGCPLPTRSFHLNLKGLPPGALGLRLQMGPRFHDVLEVLARVYVPDDPPPYKLRYLWHRMSLEKRHSIARANLYPTEMVSEEERRNLIRNRWVPVAPVGIAGREYRVRKLYTVRDDELEENRWETIFPVGVYTSREVAGILPLPPEGGEIRLEFQELDPEPRRRAAEPTLVYFNHYGESGEGVESTSANLDTEGMVLYKQLSGGILEILAPREFVVRAYLESDPRRPEITPLPAFVPAYVLTPGRALDLKVVRYWSQYTPYRIDVRQVFSDDEARFQVKPVPLHYQFLDEHGDILGSGFLVHEEPLSSHDVLIGAFSGFRITEPSRHYLAVPTGCRTLRILSTRDDLAVSAFTRPADLLRRVRIPEDSYAFYRTRDEDLNPSEDVVRTWFLVRPAHGDEWARDGLEAFVRVQSRPPARASAAPDQELEPRVLHPEGTAVAQRIVLRAENDDLEVIVGARHRYVEVPNSHEVTKVFFAQPGDDIVTPRLICLKDDHSLAPLRVYVDGQLHYQTTLASRATELELPPFDPGPHRLKISVVSSQNTSLLVSGASGSRGRMHLKRTVYRLDEEPLRYRVEKITSEREVLAVRVYMPAGVEDRAVIRAHIEILPESRRPDPDAWTFAETRFEVRRQEGELVQALASDARPLEAGYEFSVVLGSDLAAGTYRVSLHREGGPVCFVHMASMVPKSGGDGRVFIEQAREEETAE